MKTMMQILRDLTPLNRAVVRSVTDQAVDYLREVLPFRVISVPSSREHNGWVILPRGTSRGQNRQDGPHRLRWHRPSALG